MNIVRKAVKLDSIWFYIDFLIYFALLQGEPASSQSFQNPKPVTMAEVLTCPLYQNRNVTLI